MSKDIQPNKKKKTAQQFVQPKQEEKTAQQFVQAYQKLCEEYGMRIVVSPSYIARDDGSFSTVLQYSVGKLPKNEWDWHTPTTKGGGFRADFSVIV